MEFNVPSTLIKDITSGKDARRKITKGVDTLADAVSSTLGAAGNTVIYEDGMGRPIITKDGVTVAEAIVLWDPIENMGATMIKEAASRTVTEAGDGTTTATVLAQALLRNVNEHQGNHSTRDITAGINKGMAYVLEYLDKHKIPLDKDMLLNVAAISCNNDMDLGTLIASAFQQAGLEGEVLMEESEDEHTTIENTKGVQLNCGLKSQYYRTNIERGTAELENPLVLILTSPLATLRKIEQLLEVAVKKNRSILIIGELEQHPMATLTANVAKGRIKANVIDLPGFGKTKQESVTDLALMTGATPISEELGDDMDFIDVSVLGSVARSVTNAKKTVLQVDGDIEGVSERIESVKKQIKKEKNAYIKIKLQERLAILAGSVSIIKVGAETPIELKEKKDRVEDSIYAVKAAIAEGIVPGGGIALLNASLDNTDNNMPMGEKILREAIQAPFNTILRNAETVLSEPAVKKMRGTKGQGVDVVTGEFVDMVKRGIIDPVLVTKTALKNAVSVVSTIISSNTILSNRRAEQ